MDRLQRVWYEREFKLEYLQANGTAFQHLFERLMGLAYKADFMPCRPWGKEGDHKNDGFLKSEKRLFQVYAPNEMKSAKAIAKIKEDLVGAKAYWGTLFNKWVFVHNASDGLPPHVQKTILEFEQSNPGVTLEPWSWEELLLVFRKLSLEDLESWFGFVPSEDMKMGLGFGDLQVVLETIADRSVAPPVEVKPVPAGKIEANALSESAATLLKFGMAKAPLVGEFLAQWHDETLGERVAEAIRTRYRSLQGQNLPDEVFAKLETWAGGGQNQSPKHKLAVLAVLAYYFDSCDIFEEPRSARV